MHPVIGITTNLIANDQFGVEAHIGAAGQSWQALADDYVAAVQAAGGLPVLLPVLTDPDQAQYYLDRVDGILFSGGCDISPLVYGENTTERTDEICVNRDAQELALLRRALSMPHYPILGICRGCQLLNVALGGTLVSDIDPKTSGPHFFSAQRMSVPTHHISAQPDSVIAKILGAETYVNSYHHQCVANPGKGLTVTAQDEHGVPECIELSSPERFALAVQWHPEGLALSRPAHLNLFKAFVDAADDYQDRRLSL